MVSKISDAIKESLDSVKMQILAFDNKASIIVSILGIVFGLSFTAIDLIGDSIISKILYLLLLLFLITGIILSILVIIPRRKKEQSTFHSHTYYLDLNKIGDFDNYEKAVNTKTESEFEQVLANSRICTYKHILLKASIVSLIPTGIAFISLAVIILFR